MSYSRHLEQNTLFIIGIFLMAGMGAVYLHRFSSPSLSVSMTTFQNAEENFKQLKRISLKSGKERDFLRLPHIGPVLAKRIVFYRETHGFQEKKDLLNIKGIGAKTYDLLEHLIILE